MRNPNNNCFQATLDRTIRILCPTLMRRIEERRFFTRTLEKFIGPVAPFATCARQLQKLSELPQDERQQGYASIRQTLSSQSTDSVIDEANQ